MYDDDDLYADLDVLASAGYGTDEDYRLDADFDSGYGMMIGGDSDLLGEY